MALVPAVLIVGGSGFIGSQLALRFRERYKVFATYFSHPMRIEGVTSIPFNIDNRNWIKRIIHTVLPEVVIYVVGSNRRGLAESNVKNTERLHTIGPATISNFTDMIQPKFIYLSNGYVFDGVKGNYHETDITLPLTALGKIKIGGENVMRSKSLNYIIIRSSPVFGRGMGYTFSWLDRLRMNLDRKQKVLIPADELHAFAPVEGLCDLIYRIINSNLRNRIVHYGGKTKTTHFDFARKFAQAFNYDPSLISIKPNPQLVAAAQENFAFDYSLNSSYANEVLKIQSFLLEESFDLIKKQLIPGF